MATRALVFRAGTVGLVCAATEVEIEPGTERAPGTMRAVRDCTNIATELFVTPETTTALCLDCYDAVRQSTAIGVAEVRHRPESN